MESDPIREALIHIFVIKRSSPSDKTCDSFVTEFHAPALINSFTFAQYMYSFFSLISGTKSFVYDALLKIDETYRVRILDEIRAKYSLMLDAGATSFWEVIEGESAFGDAGSLSHGWSAIPILYL